MSEPPVTLEELRGVDLFDGLSDADLAEWVALAQARHVQAGEIIAEQGEETRGLQLLLDQLHLLHELSDRPDIDHCPLRVR